MLPSLTFLVVATALTFLFVQFLQVAWTLMNIRLMLVTRATDTVF